MGSLSVLYMLQIKNKRGFSPANSGLTFCKREYTPLK
uniref:Uncharacterized protein n=1 Tax=Arundo donax TaxID=35708 RepID=A0A0A9GGP6_ARUDO